MADEAAVRDPNRVPVLLLEKDDGSGDTIMARGDANGRLKTTATVSAGAPADATYVTLSTNASLTNERVLTGTANQITVTDNGAGSTVVLSTPQNIAAASSPTFAGLTLTGFSGAVSAAAGVLSAGTLSVANGGTGVTSSTGTGSVVLSNTPTLVTPVLGVATATSINGLTITSSTGTLTITNGKTLSVSNTLTLAGTDGTTMTFPSTSATLARTDAANTFTGTQTYSNAVVYTNNAIAASGNAATVPVTARLSTVTNNSAATLTITMATASAVDGQLSMVRILDASAAAQTITWVNTENSTTNAPTTSNGSTTLPLTVGFQYNSATSKWRCIAST